MNLKNYLYLVIVSMILTACGGDGNNAGETPGPLSLIIREDNPNIPAEHLGATQNNTRVYAANTGGYAASVVITGLADTLTLALNDERLIIDSNGESQFDSTFPAGTSIQLSIEEQPFLQACQFIGAVDTGIIQPDTNLQFHLDCADSNQPAAPFITQIYSSAVDSIHIEWADALDRDTANGDIYYRIYWATDRASVEDKTATSLITANGVLATDIDSLVANTLYYIAVEAVDSENNTSSIDVHSLSTITSAPVFTGVPFHVLDQTQVSIVGTTWTAMQNAFSTPPQIGNVLLVDLLDSVEIASIISFTSVGDTYEIEVGAATAADVIEEFNLSSEIGLSDPPTLVPKGTATRHSRKDFFPSLCRSSETELTETELAQITITPINSFEPRAINNLNISFLRRSVTGSFEFQGKIVVGVKVDLELLERLDGEFTCQLIGFPKRSPTLRYSIGLWPVVQDIEFDASIKLNFSAEVELKSTAQATASANLSTKVEYNPVSDKWETTFTDEFAYRSTNELSFGARATARAAIIPKVINTFYKAGTVSLSADTGANARLAVDLLGGNDAIKEFRSANYLLDEFSSDANLNLLFGAKFSVLGLTLLELVDEEIYRSPRLRIFDTPKVCTNASATRENCADYAKIAKNTSKTYDLTLSLIDGANNPADLDSIKWWVTPANGYLEVNKNDPRQATFRAKDEYAYTVVGSVTGKLGEVARKYVRFAVNADCQYGLGHELADKFEDYFVGYDVGYRFPRTIDLTTEVIDQQKDYHEVCTFGDRIVSFYAGQRNGKLTSSDGVTLVERHANGDLISRREFYPAFTLSALGPTIRSTEYSVVPDPDTNFNISVPVYEESVRSVSNSGIDLAVESGSRRFTSKLDIDNQLQVSKEFWPNGNLRKTILGRMSEITIIDESILFNSNLLSVTGYHENGYLELLADYSKPGRFSCSWRSNEFGATFHNYAAKLPGEEYSCITIPWTPP